MQALRTRSHVLLAAVLVVGGALASARCLGVHRNAARAERAAIELDAEFAAMRAAGLLWSPPATSATPDAALAGARLELLDLLERVHQADEVLGGLAFGAPAALDLRTVEEARERIEPGLHDRAELLAALAQLPEVLWATAPEWIVEPDPRGIGSEHPGVPGLQGVRSTINLMCAQAWMLAREPQGGPDAGRWLARALALARAADRGDGFGLCMRSAWENVVFDRLERLRGEAIVDADALMEPVRATLASQDDGDALQAALAREIHDLELRYRAGMRTGERLPGGADEFLAREELLDYLRRAHGLLAADSEQRRAELAGLNACEDVSYPERSLRLMARCLFDREARRALILE